MDMHDNCMMNYFYRLGCYNMLRLKCGCWFVDYCKYKHTLCESWYVPAFLVILQFDSALSNNGF